MSTGLLALLDDVAGIAKVAAASLDDVAAQATRSGAKAAGVVIDDAAVTPRFLTGFSASRELPIVGRIALGSLRNKLLYLLPAALLLSAFAPWVLTPLLMLGGAYLCYEGSEKVFEALRPHRPDDQAAATGAVPADPRQLEEQKVRSAIQTDFILSAEIMTITLGTVPEAGLATQVAVLAVVGVALTALVYGGVAVIVKADDLGLALARAERPVSGLLRGAGRPMAADRLLRPLTQAMGRGLVRGMPVFLRILAVLGTAAMIWVGGSIILHGLEGFGLPIPGHAVEQAAERAGHAWPALGAVVEWLVTAAASGLFGLLVGAALIPLVGSLAPVLEGLWGRLRGRAPGSSAR